MEILKGAETSARIKEDVKKMLDTLGGKIPKLAIVRVGERPDDVSYERSAVKKLASFGLRAEAFSYPQEISHEDFKREFKRINEDKDVDGILLLRPLWTVHGHPDG